MEASANRVDIRKIAVVAMLCAIAYALLAASKLIPFLNFIPSVGFLRYDPKDIIIVIGAFMMGPLTGAVVSVIVSLVEMVTLSVTGPIGCVMNILSSCAFACTAAAIYKKKRDMRGAVIGLAAGVIATTAVMLLWNYFLTPIYQGWPRSAVAALLIPGFLPFNLIKGSLNMALTLLLYRPLVTALRSARLLPHSASGGTVKSAKVTLGVSLVALLILISCVLLILVLRGII